MNQQIFFTLYLLLKTILIYPGVSNAEDTAVSSIQNPPTARLKCPKNLKFCQCNDDNQVSSVRCPKLFGYFSKQQLETDLRAIKVASKKFGAQGPITLQMFYWNPGGFETFDLLVLDGFSIIELEIARYLCGPSELKKIKGTPNKNHIFLNVQDVKIYCNDKLEDEGLGDTLTSFSSSSRLTRLFLHNNALTGNDQNAEFLPGLSSLKFLEELHLHGNKISSISTRHFQQLSRLKFLDLFDNQIRSVKGNLLFVHHNINPLEIVLESNLINETSFVHDNNRGSTNNFTNNENSITLDLKRNKISSLPFEVFHSFLKSNENNQIELWGNPLVCDKKVQWLRESENSSFSSQIKNAKCSNQGKEPLFKKSKSDTYFSCPEAGRIAPCTCKEGIKINTVLCKGDSILQENIDNVIQVVRQENRTPQNEHLHISYVYIDSTELTELDLTSLFHVSLDALVVQQNRMLTKVKSTQLIPGVIHAKTVDFFNNTKLDDEGLSDTLKLFSPMMTELDLSGNSLKGHLQFESDTQVKTMEREFFPGLAQLYNIDKINLTANKIEQLGVGRFRNNSKLKDIFLQDNKISTLQKDVFFFNSKLDLLRVYVDKNPLRTDLLPLNVFGSTPVQLSLNEKIHFTDDLLLGLYSRIESPISFACPIAEDIYPCNCSKDAEIVCLQANHKSVNNLFQKLKHKSMMAKSEPKIWIKTLKIIRTSIIELDLSPLIDYEISTLFIFDNVNFTKITGKNNLPKITGKNNLTSLIAVKELIVESNSNLVDSGIENLLTYFEPQIEILSLAQNSLTLNKTLNGLSNLNKLKVLNLRSNKIHQLSSNLFNGVINQQLEHLDLSENQIEKIDQDAFRFTPDDESDKTSDPLVINFNFNLITENSFPLKLTELEKFQRPIQLNLVGNKLSTMPFAPFNTLLTRKNGNFRIDLYGNPLDCDWRLSWLKKTAVFNSSSSVSVENAECVNQPRKFYHNFQKSGTQDFCYEMKDLSPCSCSSSANSLECVGNQVDNKVFQDFVSKIKTLGPFCSKEFPQLKKIVIRSTKLTHLDLADFFDVCITNLTSLVVDSNYNLTRVIGPPMGQIMEVQYLEITSNPLTDEGFGSTLKYFSPKMETLILNANQLKGSSNMEFLPGLSNLKNLSRIELNSNQIVQLSGEPFKNNAKLGQMSFVGNKISAISRKAFDFVNKIGDDSPVVIDLSLNFLNDNSLDSEMFVEKTSRPLNLDLSRNLFKTIPAAPFQNFLEANSANQLNFKDNFLECTNKLDWIKSRKHQFNRSRIIDADCEGDSIFNSKYFNSVDDGVLKTVLGVVIPAILILILVALFLWRKFRRVQDRLLYLSNKDIDEFRKGNSSINPQDLHAAVMSRPFDESLEISRDLLEFDEKDVLGSGQYGIVLKGIFKSTTGNVSVALKTVRSTADLDTFKSLLSEIKILDFLGPYQNIVQLLGASTTNIRKRDVLAVLEFCQNGDLRSYILGQKNYFQDVFSRSSKNAPIDEPGPNLQIAYENVLTTVQLVKFAMGIANGLKFLRTKNVIHGDLATRNVLLTEKLEAKISDFGLSRQLINYQNYLKSTKCALPFKWMSIEAIKDMNFSVCSDIWSFGVVLFEIFSLGETPYPGLAVDQEFLPRLIRGYRMQKPKYANQQIYDLMLDTWKLGPLDRPSSEEVLCRLHQILDQITKGTESGSCVYIEC